MARFTTIVSFALLATTAMALPSTLPAKRQDTACADVHIFLARGWNETYPGRQGKLAGGESGSDAMQDLNPLLVCLINLLTILSYMLRPKQL